jgi:hypothetical protein
MFRVSLEEGPLGRHKMSGLQAYVASAALGESRATLPLVLVPVPGELTKSIRPVGLAIWVPFRNLQDART